MTDRLRIVRIIARLNVGGPARHVVWLTSALNTDEFESVLITGSVPAGEDDMSSFAEEHDVRPIFFREMSREISPADVVTIWKLFRFFRRYRPHIIHTHTAKAGAAGRIAGALYRWITPSSRRCHIIHTFHGHIFHSYYGKAKTAAFLWIERALARVTDRIVVLSPQQLEEIHDRFRVGRRDQFRVVPLGIDMSALLLAPDQNRLRSELGVSADETMIAIVGRLVEVKNHRMFLRVAKRFKDAGPTQRARFVIFGDGAIREDLEAFARELGLGADVIFAGTRPAPEIYRSSDVIVLTSLNEGTPLTIIEAMAAGRPVVSTAIGGVIDLLGTVTERVVEPDGRYEVRQRGLTAGSNDVEGFTAALRRVLSDAPLRALAVDRARAFALGTFSKDRLVADIMNLYRELRVQRSLT